MKQPCSKDYNNTFLVNVCHSLCVCVCVAVWQTENRDVWGVKAAPCIRCHLIFSSSADLVIPLSSITPHRFATYSCFILLSSWLSVLHTPPLSFSFFTIRVFVHEQAVGLCRWWAAQQPAQLPHMEIKLLGSALTLTPMLWCSVSGMSLELVDRESPETEWLFTALSS